MLFVNLFLKKKRTNKYLINLLRDIVLSNKTTKKLKTQNIVQKKESKNPPKPDNYLLAKIKGKITKVEKQEEFQMSKEKKKSELPKPDLNIREVLYKTKDEKKEKDKNVRK